MTNENAKTPEIVEMRRMLFDIELILSKLDVFNQQCFQDSPEKQRILQTWFLLTSGVRDYRAHLSNVNLKQAEI